MEWDGVGWCGMEWDGVGLGWKLGEDGVEGKGWVGLK